MHEKYWAEAGLSCGHPQPRRRTRDSGVCTCGMFTYVMTAEMTASVWRVAPLAVYRYKQSHSLKPYTRSTTTLYCTRPFPRYVRPD